MWRRRFSSGWGRRRTGGMGRSGFSYGTAVLLVSAAIVLFLYLTGRLAI